MKITLTTMQAISLAKGIAPAISTDPTKHHLHAIQVETTGEYATFTATDGYRLHRITVPQTDIDPIPTFQVGGVELVGALCATAKAIGKGSGLIELDYDYDDKVTITGASVTMNVPVVNMDFPNCASILDMTGETERGAFYDTVYLSEIVIAAGHISGKAKKNTYWNEQLVKIENIHPRRPMHVTAQNVTTGMQFHGVLMPRQTR